MAITLQLSSRTSKLKTFLVLGSWSLVLGSWFLVLGSWSWLERELVPVTYLSGLVSLNVKRTVPIEKRRMPHTNRLGSTNGQRSKNVTSTIKWENYKLKDSLYQIKIKWIEWMEWKKLNFVVFKLFFLLLGVQQSNTNFRRFLDTSWRVQLKIL